MCIQFAADRAGLFWSGLGVSLHVAKDERASGEAAAWWSKGSFRLGNLTGAIARI